MNAISVADVQNKVSAWLNAPVLDMCSDRRGPKSSRPRHIAMYLARKFTTSSYPEIGRQFGGRDHTSVIYAVGRVEQLRQQDDELNCLVRGFEMVFSERLESGV